MIDYDGLVFAVGATTLAFIWIGAVVAATSYKPLPKREVDLTRFQWHVAKWFFDPNYYVCNYNGEAVAALPFEVAKRVDLLHNEEVERCASCYAAQMA